MAHILLIEPDRLLAKMYLQAMTSAGHTVQVCAGAQSAVFCADERCPDVVVAELQLVGHSGIEFLYEFRSYAEWQHIPVVVVTNVPAGEFRGSWQLLREQLGVADYHYKPLMNLRTLLSSINDALASQVV